MKKLFLIAIIVLMSGCAVKENAELAALEKEVQDLQDDIAQNEIKITAFKNELATLEAPLFIPISIQWANQLILADIMYGLETHEQANKRFITYDSVTDTTTIQFLRINLKMVIEGKIPEKILVNRSAFGIEFGYAGQDGIQGIATYFIMSNAWGFQEISGKRSIVSGHDIGTILTEEEQAEADAFLRRKKIFVEGN